MNRSLTFSYLEEYWVRIFFSLIIDSLTQKFFFSSFSFFKEDIFTRRSQEGTDWSN